MINFLHSFFGVFAFVFLACLFSESRQEIPWRLVFSALFLQFALALLLLKIPAARVVFLLLNKVVYALEQATQAGTSFVFGYLGGAKLPFVAKAGSSSYILAFRGLPLILVVSALSSLFYYWRILPLVVKGCARVLERMLGIGGAEGVAIASNIFLGMMEAPLLIRGYLHDLDRGELFSLMTSGMATIAGTVMVLYASILTPVLPNALGHLLIASILSAPAAVAMARIIIPTPPEQITQATMVGPVQAASSMEAVTQGTLEGMQLLINILAMLIVLVALVSLANQCLALLPLGRPSPLTLQRLLGWIMAPVVWLLGLPWSECQVAGSLMGTKTILNEFLAYLDLAHLPPGSLSQRSELIMTYALCGFANLGSLGIMLGGLGSLVPERRSEIVALGLKSIIAGTLATCLTGAVVGCLVLH